MPTRQINSPGVEIREIDRSQVAPSIVGTNCLLMGYSQKGESLNPVDLVSVSDLEVNFGQPTNEAERYFYYTAKSILLENGNLVAAKLPYNVANTSNDSYKAVPINLGTSAAFSTLSATPLYGTDLATAISELQTFPSVNTFTSLEINTPINLTLSDYDSIKSIGDFSTIASISGSDYIIVNENSQELLGPNSNQGLFVSIVSPFQGALVQRVIAGTSADPMVVFNNFSNDTTSTFTKALTGAYSDSSISEDIMNFFPNIEFTSNGTDIDSTLLDHISVVVGKTIANPDNNGALSIQYIESFSGSILPTALDPSTGQSTFIGDIINGQSKFIKLYKNPTTNATITANSILMTNTLVNDTLDLLAFPQLQQSQKLINGNKLILDIKSVFDKVANIDERQIDVVVDAGLTTISEYCTSTTISGLTSGLVFDPKNETIDRTIVSVNETDVWRQCASELIDFCENTRKDCIAVLDGSRALALTSDSKRIRKTAPDNSFSNQIGPKLKWMTGLNTSFAALYIDWMRQYDIFSGQNVWLPPSFKVGGIYVRNDRIGNFWDAPAGLNRGLLDSINDIAFNPTQKEADQVYPKGMNYCKHYPTDGFVLEGQKTALAKPSSFDRVNVRRLFLRLERLTYQVSRFFVMEPNNLFTRRRLVSTLLPTFESVKAQGGLYDFKIICDETNNTPDVIDRNELKVAILLKATRTAEFILVDFVSLKTSASFSEYI